MSILFAGLLLLTLISPVSAAPVRVDAVTADLLTENIQVKPGEPFTIGLQLIHDAGWHTYWLNPGDSGLPTQFPVQADKSVTVGPIQWPIPARMLIPPLANLGFEEETLLMRELTLPADFQGESAQFSTLAQWLVCREVCIPGQAELSVQVKVGPLAEPGPAAGLFEFARKRLPGDGIAVPARLSEQALTIQLPADIAGDDFAGAGKPVPRLEYFPFGEGLIHNAAPQKLSRIDGAGKWQLEVALEPPPDPSLNPSLAVKPAAPPTLSQAGGLIVINKHTAVEIKPEPAGFASLSGAAGPVTMIEGHVVPIFAQLNAADNFRKATGGGSLLGDLLSGGAATSSPASSAAASPAAPNEPSAPAADGGETVQSLSLALLFALLGGLILNLMPCVFPVIGLKILGFAGSGAGGQTLTPEARANVRNGSLWFALGVILAFIALGALLLILRATGESIGWGFQLQSPVFVIFMALLFIAVGLNFSGVYEVGVSMTRLGNLQQPQGHQAEPSHNPAGAVGAGVLAVLVATPCTAPFMGSALGFTLAQPAAATMLIFVALGLGMSLPYFVLGFMPGWLRWLPRPGRWMESLRQLLAFPMYAAAAWLAWVLGLQTSVDAVLSLSLAAVVLALALWVLGRHVQANPSASRFVYLFISIALLVGAGLLARPDATNLVNGHAAAGANGSVKGTGTAAGWQTWSGPEVDRLLEAGSPVFIDFTAAWCISCQVNKKMVLTTADVQAAFQANGVVTMRADWTTQDPAITAELARHSRNSVPLYLLYKPGAAAPVVLPELLSKSIVLDALDALGR